MLFRREIEGELINKLDEYTKAIIVYGPRQVGKTTLCRQVLAKTPYSVLEINADEARYIEVLSSRNKQTLLELTAGYDVLFLDEAQRVPDIGLNLKILIDARPTLRIMATGSSSFELANRITEPLTGRTWVYYLYPMAAMELAARANSFELTDSLPDRLRWGSYPNIFSLPGEKDKAQYLRQLTSNYLYKDIFSLADVRHSEKIHSLVKLLGFQIGSEVSLTELANNLDMSKETVARYIDLLEKSFVIKKLTGFSRNLRKEVTKMPKYYFYDLGLRNAVIDNLNRLGDRNDAGQLWENFLVMERLKKNTYNQVAVTPYFWRTYTGAEIDYIEEGGGRLAGYEFKWNARKKARAPRSWLKEYDSASWEMITTENWVGFAA